MTNEERIKADADNLDNILKSNDYRIGFKYGYIAGATDENSRAQVELKEAQGAARMFCNKHNETATQLAELVDKAQVLVDALEAIAGITMPVPNKADMIEIAKKHLEQWKGKEVKLQPDLGICVECKTRPATTDYNGHQHYVCQLCDDSLNREFDEEYR